MSKKTTKVLLSVLMCSIYALICLGILMSICFVIFMG